MKNINQSLFSYLLIYNIKIDSSAILATRISKFKYLFCIMYSYLLVFIFFIFTYINMAIPSFKRSGMINGKTATINLDINPEIVKASET